MAGTSPPECRECPGWARKGEIVRLYRRKSDGKGHVALGWMCVKTRHIRWELTDEEALERAKYGPYRESILLEATGATVAHGHSCHDPARCVHLVASFPAKRIVSKDTMDQAETLVRTGYDGDRVTRTWLKADGTEVESVEAARGTY